MNCIYRIFWGNFKVIVAATFVFIHIILLNIVQSVLSMFFVMIILPMLHHSLSASFFCDSLGENELDNASKPFLHITSALLGFMILHFVFQFKLFFLLCSAIFVYLLLVVLARRWRHISGIATAVSLLVFLVIW